MKTRIFIFIGMVGLLSACTFYDYETEIDERDRVIGNYEVEEYSETYDDLTYYSMYITKSRYREEIYLNNFYAADLRVLAILEYNRITIPFQVVDGYEIEGVGTVYGNELDLNYSVRDRYSDAPTDFCETQAWFEY